MTFNVHALFLGFPAHSRNPKLSITSIHQVSAIQTLLLRRFSGCSGLLSVNIKWLVALYFLSVTVWSWVLAGVLRCCIQTLLVRSGSLWGGGGGALGVFVVSAATKCRLWLYFSDGNNECMLSHSTFKSFQGCLISIIVGQPAPGYA